MDNLPAFARRLFRKSPNGKSYNAQVEPQTEDVMHKPTIITSSFYLLVILFIGFPMWWYTCTTTRYTLPDAKNFQKALESEASRLHLDISIIYLQKNQEELLEYLRDDLPRNIVTKFDNITYQILWRVRRPTQSEVDIFDLFEQESDAKRSLVKLESLLTRLHKTTDRFRLFIYVPEESQYIKYGCKSSHTFNIGHERFVFMCPNNLLMFENNFAPIKNMITQILHTTHIDSVHRTDYLMPAKLDLVVTMISEFDQLDDLAEKTNLVHDIFDKNVKKKFSELTEILNIRLLSQQFIDFELETIETVNATRRFVDIGEVDSIFNRFESRVSKHCADNVFNLLLFVPSPKKQSLVFKQMSATKLSDELSILIGPDSNSMLIANDDKTLVLGLRTLVRHLLGLSSVGLCNNCQVKRDVFINRWELDAIVGILTKKKLQATALSLQSIGTQMSNIRILKEVADKIQRANDLALEAIRLLQLKNTLEAYRRASLAYELSESAFFDPSLLESLYFPDDLKYAVYLPLFLPLAFPILMSINRLAKAFAIYRKPQILTKKSQLQK